MDPIPKEEMGNATSMFNLMRNLGGGFGIAAATTFLFRRQQFHTQRLGEHVTNFVVQQQYGHLLPAHLFDQSRIACCGLQPNGHQLAFPNVRTMTGTNSGNTRQA